MTPSCNAAGPQMFYKSARVEYHPLGVVSHLEPAQAFGWFFRIKTCAHLRHPASASCYVLLHAGCFTRAAVTIFNHIPDRRHCAVELPFPQCVQPAGGGALRRQRHRHQGASDIRESCTYHSNRKDSISLASRALARLVSSGSRNVADASLPGLHVSARTCQTSLQVCTELPGLHSFAKRGSTCSIFLRFRQTN